MNLYAGFVRSMSFKILIISMAGLRIIRLDSINALLFVEIDQLVSFECKRIFKKIYTSL